MIILDCVPNVTESMMTILLGKEHLGIKIKHLMDYLNMEITNQVLYERLNNLILWMNLKIGYHL